MHFDHFLNFLIIDKPTILIFYRLMDEFQLQTIRKLIYTNKKKNLTVKLAC